MTETPQVYRIITRVHINQWSAELSQAIPGWELRCLWLATGTTLPVFVPDSVYTPENVDALVKAAGATDDAIHALGA
jgi:hypothetical protein